jgi:DNA-binding response OmpR family regulator
MLCFFGAVMSELTNCSVLVVEDDVSVGQALSDALRSAGYRCEVARSSQAAFDHLQQAQAFDVVILDLQLAEERSEDLVDRLQRANVVVPPLVIVSGRPNAELRVAGSKTHAAAWLKKPFSIESVIAAIDIAINPTKIVDPKTA